MHTLRYTLFILTISRFILLPLPVNAAENTTKVFSPFQYNGPSQYVKPVPYEKPILLRAWGDGDDEESLEPGGGTENGSAFNDVPINDTGWIGIIFCFFYTFIRYTFNVKWKSFNRRKIVKNFN